jgi:hypothetical protein
MLGLSRQTTRRDNLAGMFRMKDLANNGNHLFAYAAKIEIKLKAIAPLYRYKILEINNLWQLAK